MTPKHPQNLTVDNTYEQLKNQVLDFMAKGINEPSRDKPFNDLAISIFGYQFAENEPYRKYCLKKGAAPESVQHWLDIPTVPTAAFKELPITCFPPNIAERVFTTSGTTVPGKHGRHYMRTLELYNASLRPNFLTHVLPEGPSIRMLILAPPSDTHETSSLSYMLEEVRKDYGTPTSSNFLGPNGLDYKALHGTLRSAEAAREPVCLLGTAFAFVHFLDRCTEQNARFRLPSGSRIIDTGGYKGRSREVAKDELYRLYETTMDVPQHYIINEYGMTEMATQFYDSVLVDKTNGISSNRHKVIPPWARTVVVNPDTLERTPKGEVGLLRHLDLANLSSIIGIQTEDLGYETEQGFEVLGRARGAETRGCSIAVDELLSALES